MISKPSTDFSSEVIHKIHNDPAHKAQAQDSAYAIFEAQHNRTQWNERMTKSKLAKEN